jgi:predicted dehydrogenase
MSTKGTSQSPAQGQLTRRTFLATAGAAASALTIVPRSVLGGPGHVPPSSKINLGFIGVGSQGLRVLLSFLKIPDVQAVAVCDPNKANEDYPQWSKGEFSTAVHRLLGINAGWEWLSPNQPIPLTPSLTASGGVAGRDPCRKIVDAYYGSQKRSGQSQSCRAYRDFRELLSKEKDLDAVVVCTPDHLHAAVSVAAMKKGKHVYCQKPMAHSVYEAQRMAEVARATGVATQVAVMNQASEDTRRLAEWLGAGVIGPVREVHNWSSRPFWPQGLDRPQQAQPVPEGLDWDLWLGPAPERPFHHAYQPFVWRGWYDFGCGALGDMGQYSLDTIFRVLKLGAPTRVEASSSTRHAESFPQASIIHFHFPARGELPSVRLTWYDGGLRPQTPDELEGGPLPEEGLLFRGERGAILCGFNGRRPRLLPESRMKNFQQPLATLPRSPGHQREWLDACAGSKTRPGADFEFSGLVTLALQLGNVALRAGQPVLWDPASQSIVNASTVKQYLHPPFRPGWTF